MMGIRSSIRATSAAALVALAWACPVAAQDGADFRADDLLAMQVYLVGGGFKSFARNGSVTGVDLTNSPGNVSNVSGGGASVAPLLGARVHIPMLWYMRDQQHLGFSAFFETGLQSGFGKQSFSQGFANTSVNAGDIGSQTVAEYLQIPVLVGVTVPVAGRNGPAAALFDVYGGFTFDSWALVIQGNEGNSGGQQGFYGQNRRFTADPTAGVGVRVPVGSLDAGVPLFVGLNAEVQLRPGSVVQAFSNNFPVAYYGTIDPYANVAVMARIGVAFGSR